MIRIFSVLALIYSSNGIAASATAAASGGGGAASSGLSIAIGGATAAASAAAAASTQSFSGNGWIHDKVSISHVCFMGAHNAPFSKKRGWGYAQQLGNIPDQLAAGVRFMKTPIRYYVRWDHSSGMKKEDPMLALSHEGFFKERNSLTSHIQKGTLGNPTDSALDFMKELRSFLLENINDVLILVLETHNMIPSKHTCTQDKTVSDMKEDIARLFVESGLDQFAHKLNLGADGMYPTFGDLRGSGKRLIVFSSHDRYDLDTPFTNTTRFYAESDYKRYGEHDTMLRTKDADAKGKGIEKFFLMNNFHPASFWRTCFYQEINSFEYLARRFANFKAVRPQADEERAFIPAMGYLPNAVLLDYAEIGDGNLFAQAVNLDNIRTFHPDLLTNVMQARLHDIGETRMRMLSPSVQNVPVVFEVEREIGIPATLEAFAQTIFGPHVVVLPEDMGIASAYLEAQEEQSADLIALLHPTGNNEAVYIDDNVRRTLAQALGSRFREASKGQIIQAFVEQLRAVPTPTPVNDLMLAYGRILVHFLPQIHLFEGIDEAQGILCDEFDRGSGKTRAELLSGFNVPMNRVGAFFTGSTTLTAAEMRKAYNVQLARRCLLSALYDGQTSLNLTIQSPELMGAMIGFFGLKVGNGGSEAYETPLEAIVPNNPFVLIEDRVATISFLQLDEASLGATVEGFKVGRDSKGVIALRLSKPDASDPYPGGRLTIAAGDVNPSRSVSGWAGTLVGAVNGPNLMLPTLPVRFITNLREPFMLKVVSEESNAVAGGGE